MLFIFFSTNLLILSLSILSNSSYNCPFKSITVLSLLKISLSKLSLLFKSLIILLSQQLDEIIKNENQGIICNIPKQELENEEQGDTNEI